MFTKTKRYSLSQPKSLNDKNICLTDEETKVEHILFTSAALDGLAAYISPFIDHITTSPDIYIKVLAEIDDAEKRGALFHPVVQYEQTNTLPYFSACISECLRFESPAQTILPRYVSSGGLDVSDILPKDSRITNPVVPAGTEIAASLFIIHRHKGIFGDDADVFRPERWMESQEANQLMEDWGMWWGYGRRECAGKHLAQIQVRKLCLEILRRFEVTQVNPKRKFLHKRWAVGMFWEQEMTFSKRKRPHAMEI